MIRQASQSAFLQGSKAALSAPAWVLVVSFFGFGALAQDLGFGLFQTLLIAAFIYALPGQVVLITAMAQGMALIPLVLAVSFSAARLFPMTVSLMPQLKMPNTPRWQLYAASHFVAITIWIESMRRLPELERADRLPFFIGFGIAMIATSTLGSAAGYLLSNSLSVMLSAALLFLMPIYFLVTLSNAARTLADRYAFTLGLVLGPLVYMIFPQGDLIVTGLVGGTLGWLAARWREQKSACNG